MHRFFLTHSLFKAVELVRRDLSSVKSRPSERLASGVSIQVDPALIYVQQNAGVRAAYGHRLRARVKDLGKSLLAPFQGPQGPVLLGYIDTHTQQAFFLAEDDTAGSEPIVQPRTVLQDNVGPDRCSTYL